MMRNLVINALVGGIVFAVVTVVLSRLTTGQIMWVPALAGSGAFAVTWFAVAWWQRSRTRGQG